jgi:hypothetical protein
MEVMNLSLEVIKLYWLHRYLGPVQYDGITRRRVHPVYWIGLAGLAVALTRLSVMQTELWLRIGRAILGLLV